MEEELTKARNLGIPELIVIANSVSMEVNQINKEAFLPLYYKYYELSEYIQTVIWFVNANVRTELIKQMYTTLKTFAEIDNLRLWHQLVEKYICSD